MNAEWLHTSDGPAVQAYMDAEARTIEQMIALAASMATTDPSRASQVRVVAQRRTTELLALREWLDLR